MIDPILAKILGAKNTRNQGHSAGKNAQGSALDDLLADASSCIAAKHPKCANERAGPVAIRPAMGPLERTWRRCDILIAATALTAELTLVHNNKSDSRATAGLIPAIIDVSDTVSIIRSAALFGAAVWICDAGTLPGTHASPIDGDLSARNRRHQPDPTRHPKPPRFLSGVG